MPVPALRLSSDPALDSDLDVLVLGVVKTDDGPRLATDADLAGDALADIATALSAIGATGAADELRRLPSPRPGGPALALVGLGALDRGATRPTRDALRAGAGAAIRQLAGIRGVAIALPVADGGDAAAVLDGASAAAYAYSAYRRGADTAKAPVAEVVVHAPADVVAVADALTARAHAVATAIHAVRDLVNTPPNDLYPASFAARAVELAEGLPVEVDILEEDALEAGGYGGILGVGRGSTRGPRLVVVRYAPADATRHLSLVGKGITFDSGGLSLKPATAMVGMKYDMTGAATVLAVTLAAARLGLPVRITARLCLAENLPSGTATRPNDVLRMRGGTTVEVLNTDAEGRLVLADGLVDASAENPDALVDVATLTGAARVAMGERVVPVMGDEDLGRRLAELARGEGEQIWPMPLPAELRSVLDSDIADIANAKPGNTAGGMLLAGQFLRAFVGDRPDGSPVPWAHLDIAGTASNGGAAYGAVPKGPTGVTVRALVALAEDFGRA